MVDNILDSIKQYFSFRTKKFSDLKVIENSGALDKKFVDRYVVPFYLGGNGIDDFTDKYKELNELITPDIVLNLLGDPNWRSKSVGAYFTAIGNFKEYESNIGKLLLRSDACYVGHDYCLALASFATPTAINYLNQYLEYYLTKPNLWFDQASAMAALSYIGTQKEDDLLTEHLESWTKFISNKKDWSLDSSIKKFTEQMLLINNLKREVGS